MENTILPGFTYSEDPNLNASINRAFSFAKKEASNPVGMISTNQGIEALNKAKTTEANLTPSPKTETTPSVPTKATPTKVRLLNPNTMQEISFEDAGVNRKTIEDYIGSGYQVAEASGNIPSWLNTAGDPTAKAQRNLNTAREERDAAVEQLKNLNVDADPALNTLLTGITSLWDSRIADMERSNIGRKSAIATTGVRIGSQFTGGQGGMFGGVIAEEERQGIQRISALQAEKMAALAEARNAYKNQKWSEYSKLVDIAEKKYTSQLNEVKELNNKVAEQNKLLTDQIKQEKERTYKEFTKPVQDIIAEAAKNGAPEGIITAIEGAKSLSEAVKAAGGYLQTGSGMVAEYNFYKRDAESRGLFPLSFDEYQTRDANRKVSLARAAQPVAGTNLTSQQQAVFNRIVDKYNSSEAIKALDRASSLKSIIQNVKDNPNSAAGQLNLIYAYIKGLDTDSAVREGEIDLVRSINSYLDKFQLSLERVASGKPVTEKVALEIANEASKLISAIEETAKRKRAVFDAQAKQNGDAVYGAWKGFRDTLEQQGSLTDELNSTAQESKKIVDDFITSRPDMAETISGLYEVEGATDETILEYLRANGLIQ